MAPRTAKVEVLEGADPAFVDFVETTAAEAFDGTGPVVRITVGGSAAPEISAGPNCLLELSLPGKDPGPAALLAAAEARAWTLPDRTRRDLDRLLDAWGSDGGEVLAVYPEILNHHGTERELVLRNVAARFRYIGSLVLGVSDAALGTMPEGHRVVPLAEALRSDRLRALVLPLGPKVQFPPELNQRLDLPLFRLDSVPEPIVIKDGKADFAPPARGSSFHPHAEANVFTSMGLSDVIGTPFEVHPVRIAHRTTAQGPRDVFGFRNGCACERLVERGPGHVVVACFGGSALYGDKVWHDDTIPARLEVMLEDWAAEARPDLCFTVLNFGIQGGAIADETQAWLTHATRIRPEVVISHTGNNDATYGMVCDPALLRDHGLIYNVSAFIRRYGMRTDQLPRGNPPNTIVKAIVDGLERFRRLARAEGAVFLAGLQPIWTGKALNPAERAVVESVLEYIKTGMPHFRDIDRVGFLYEQVQRALNDAVDDLLDFQNLQGDLAEEKTIYLDHVHLNAAGNQWVADHYFQRIRDLVLAGAIGPEAPS